jgi:RND family efflux transporter MFP subunit
VKKATKAANLETKEIIIKPKRKHKKYLWFVLVLPILGLASYFAFGKNSTTSYKPAYTVAMQDVKQTVIATGTVTSETDLNLSFKTSGIISKINVKVGDKVSAGQVLASLDAKDAQAQVAVAQASVNSAQVALNNARNNYKVAVRQQQTLVDNTYATMLSANLIAQNSNSSNTVNLAISGTYTGKEQGSYKISLQLTGAGYYYNVSGLEVASGPVQTNIPIALGTKGLYMTFPTYDLSSAGTWTVNIPNMQSSSYVTNNNAYQSALQTQEQQLTAAQGAIDTALAALGQAQAQLLVAQNAYSNNLIESPITGQVTSVDAKIGEQIAALREVVVVLDPTMLHAETQIPESSINQVRPNQDIGMTFDALGQDQKFMGKVISIDPASTVVSGVIDFRVIASLPEDSRIKPGMTVNLSIIISEKQNVLAIPNRLINSVNGKRSVKVMTGTTVTERELVTGLAGDNYTEILSGITNGEVIVTEAK